MLHLKMQPPCDECKIRPLSPFVSNVFPPFQEEESSVDDQISREPLSPLSALLGVIRKMFPENVARAAVNMNILGIITFSLMFGLALASIGDAGDAMVSSVDVSFPSCD